MQVVPRALDGSLINIGGYSGWNSHTIEIREDGQFYIGPNQGVAGPSNISASSSLFPSSSPKLDIVSGLSNLGYNECIVLRHPNVDSTPATRRLGMIMKLSSEGSSVESSKMGGVVLESTLAFANNPELSIVLGESKRLRLTNIDLFANIHNTGGGTAGHLNPSISSGTYSPVASGLVNCAVTHTDNAYWLRVGNVVTVSGRVSVDPTNVSTNTQFRLTIPISYSNMFGINTFSPVPPDSWPLS